MGENHNFKLLREHIISLSESDVWATAKREWYLDSISYSNEPQTCPCSQHPIRELCHIRNVLNGHQTTVGNVCVTRFIGISDAEKIFAAVRYVEQDTSRGLNPDAAVYFRNRRVINDWEYGFVSSTHGKRNLTGKQLVKRVAINEKVIRSLGKAVWE